MVFETWLASFIEEERSKIVQLTGLMLEAVAITNAGFMFAPVSSFGHSFTLRSRMLSLRLMWRRCACCIDALWLANLARL